MKIEKRRALLRSLALRGSQKATVKSRSSTGLSRIICYSTGVICNLTQGGAKLSTDVSNCIVLSLTSCHITHLGPLAFGNFVRARYGLSRWIATLCKMQCWLLRPVRYQVPYVSRDASTSPDIVSLDMILLAIIHTPSTREPWDIIVSIDETSMILVLR